jgi:aldose 1-epimerase
MANKYSVGSSLRDGTTIWELEEANTASVEIAPEWGNNCFSFRTLHDILEPVSFEEFALRPRSYGIPILFPFPNRIKDGKFLFAGKTYPVNPKQHGYVRDKKWSVIDSGASDTEGAWVRSRFDAEQYPEQILQQFPFPFQLEVEYRLKEGRLLMDTLVLNSGNEKVPFGFGIHPYFRLPERGTLELHAEKRWELIDSIPTGKILDLEGQFDLNKPRDVHSLSLDDIFTELHPDEDGMARCVLRDELNQVQTVVEFDPHRFPHVVLYTVPAPRRAFCIEPYTCPTDAFNLQNSGVEANVLLLLPKTESRFRISVYTEPIR